MLPPFHPAHTIEVDESEGGAFSQLDQPSKEAIVHYVKHGDSKCNKCNNGFRIYWSEKKEKY